MTKMPMIMTAAVMLIALACGSSEQEEVTLKDTQADISIRQGFDLVDVRTSSDANVYWQLGISHLKERNYIEALENFDRVVIMEPDFAWGYAARGFALVGLQDGEEALADLDKAINNFGLEDDAIYQARAGAYGGIASESVNLGDFDKAISYYKNAIADFEKAIELNASNADGAREMIVPAEEHIRIIERERQVSPSQPMVRQPRELIISSDASEHYELGVVLLKEHRYDDAIRNFDRAIELNQGYAERAKEQKAEAYLLKINDKSKLPNYYSAEEVARWAIGHLNTSIALNPNNAEAYYWRSQFWYDIYGHEYMAWSDINKAISLDPDNEYYQYLKDEHRCRTWPSSCELTGQGE